MAVGKLHMGDLVGLGTWVKSIEDLKVGFNLLVDLFCFAIRLELIGSGEGEVVVEELSKLLDKGRCKLWTSIRDDLIIQPKAQVNFVEKESSYLLHSDGFLNGAENYPLCKAMIDHDQQGIKARGSREVGDEVTRDLLEGVRCVGLDQSHV